VDSKTRALPSPLEESQQWDRQVSQEHDPLALQGWKLFQVAHIGIKCLAFGLGRAGISLKISVLEAQAGLVVAM
jgi:hypothetical protein